MPACALRRWSVCTFVAVLLGGCSNPSWPALELERYRLSLALMGDGSLAVDETLVFSEQPTPTRVLEYRLPSSWLDAIADVAVFVDDEALPEGRGPGSVEVVPEPGGRVRWWPHSETVGGRELRLTYRAMGVMAVSGARGQLRWPVVPKIGGPIGRVQVLLSLPDRAIPVVGPLVDEDGWTLTRGAAGYEVSRSRLGAGETAVLWTELVLEDLSVPEPVWQYNAARGRELTPAFVSAGLFLVVIALGSLAMISFQYRPVRVTSDGAPAGPPLEPTLVAALTGPASLRWCPRATVDALAGAGLADPERVVVGRGLRAAGVVVFVVGLLSVIAVDLLLGHFGNWPMALPAGILGAAATFGVAGWRFPVLTEAGELARRQARSRGSDEHGKTGATT